VDDGVVCCFGAQSDHIRVRVFVEKILRLTTLLLIRYREKDFYAVKELVSLPTSPTTNAAKSASFCGIP
jgi:hypothetical protein